MLQYITNTDCGKPVVDQILAVMEGGCRWIQIRMKDASDDEIREVVKQVLPKAAETETFLLLDDRVALCKELEMTGVHLGKDDMPPSQARMELGPAAVIGTTANTIEDIEAVKALDTDYVGVGPYTMTTTKKNLSPVLGLEGIRSLCEENRSRGIEKPLVAIGGITLEDVTPLLEAGVNGIAVSGAIAKAEDMVKATRDFIALLPTPD
ncbi:MAG: thiamine phosphate synthase [Clostridium sp.]|nr:thiamine phosphate synthase [Prevotella sp.]MCM1429317.1 thiamine phosphate synthase [Clostridium sp.]MCM1475650.1 thiamine phosphate synthase [Muribaculaceae bacterium]